MTAYRWYDRAGERYGMSKAKVIATVKKHGLPKRRIWGAMAVDAEAWDTLMQTLDIPLAPGWRTQ